MASVNRDSQPIPYKMVYELRYDYGYSYLDRCGSTINSIIRSDPLWHPVDTNPQRGVLKHSETNVIFSFNALKLDVSQELSHETSKLLSEEQFAALAEELTQEVIQSLELEVFSRIGFRAWNLIGFNTLQDAKSEIKNSGYVDYTPIIAELRDCEDVDEIGYSFVITREKCWTRIAVAAVEQACPVDDLIKKQSEERPHRHPPEERKALLLKKIRADKLIKSFPTYAVLVDIDHFLKDPPQIAATQTVSDFISAGCSWNECNSQIFLRKAL